MRYVLVEDDTDVIMEEVEGDKEFRTGTPPDLPQKPFRWLPLEVTNPDVPDHATHLKEGPVTTVENKRVTRVWTVRKKTDKELDSIQFKSMLDVENRTRALEKNPALTVEKYKASLKGML